MKRSARLALLVGLAVADGCAKRQTENLVVFTLTTKAVVPGPLTVILTVAGIEHKAPADIQGLTTEPVTLGVYVRESVNGTAGVAVSARAVSKDRCIYEGDGTAMSDATGRVATVTLALQPQGSCTGVPDGGIGRRVCGCGPVG